MRLKVEQVLLLPLLLALFGVRVAAPADEGYQLIVHVASPLTEVTRDELSRFFLRQSSRWADGKEVLPVDQSSRSAVRDVFSRGVLRQPLPAVESYWRRQIASGRALPPPVKTSDAEVLAYVASTPGAVGYVSGGLNLTPGVKPLRLKE
jgi:ABC-type phosphate transport system substrate-binding protein